MKADRLFILHRDPGHAWLAVPMSYLRELGIVHEISSFSYMNVRTSTAYLEEDCDAADFWEAWVARFGTAPSIHESYSNRQSTIRRMDPYNAAVVEVKACL